MADAAIATKILVKHAATTTTILVKKPKTLDVHSCAPHLQREGKVSVLPADGIGDGHEFRAVGERALHLHLVELLCYSSHHLPRQPHDVENKQF